MKCFLNGQLVDEAQARVSIFDRSYLYGEGVFETLRSYDGHVAFLDRHYNRLKKNCEALCIPLQVDVKTLGEWFEKTLRANDLKEASVRLTLSSQGASTGLAKPKSMPVNLSIFCSPITIDLHLYQTGVETAITTSVINDEPKIAGIKSTNYLTKMRARDEAVATGVYEGLLTNSAGYIIEGSRTNLFLVQQGILLTAPFSDGLLPGVTREVVLELAAELGIALRETHITKELLQTADELFLTGTTTEIMGIHTVRGVTKKSKTPGPVTQSLHQAYCAKIKTA